MGPFHRMIRESADFSDISVISAQHAEGFARSRREQGGVMPQNDADRLA
jgi:hypothetical protein